MMDPTILRVSLEVDIMTVLSYKDLSLLISIYCVFDYCRMRSLSE